MKYTLFNDIDGKVAGACLNKEDGSAIAFTFSPENTDYQAYLEWISQGNTPLPADEVTV